MPIMAEAYKTPTRGEWRVEVLSTLTGNGFILIPEEAISLLDQLREQIAIMVSAMATEEKSAPERDPIRTEVLVSAKAKGS